MAIVGDVSNETSEFSNNKLIIWDDSLMKKISELQFDSEILRVKIKTDKVILTTKNNNLYVIELLKLNCLNIFEIYQNSNGLFSISSDEKILVIAFPYANCGFVKIKHYNADINVPHINAHDTNISFLALNVEGNLLATCSQRGTLVRIFNTFNGELIQELRRGAKKAEIHFINFDLNNKFLACSSNSGTIHIFSIYTSIKYLKEKGIIKNKSEKENKKEETNIKGEKIEIPKNQKSFIGSIISVLKLGISYFESEWSFAQFRLPKSENAKAIVSFSQFDNSINVLTKSGNLYKASFEPNLGGECDKINEINLFQENPENS
jgi:WD40 repeat protein